MNMQQGRKIPLRRGQNTGLIQFVDYKWLQILLKSNVYFVIQMIDV